MPRFSNENLRKQKTYCNTMRNLVLFCRKRLRLRGSYFRTGFPNTSAAVYGIQVFLDKCFCIYIMYYTCPMPGPILILIKIQV